jgi:hypothetical protein
MRKTHVHMTASLFRERPGLQYSQTTPTRGPFLIRFVPDRVGSSNLLTVTLRRSTGW